MKRITVYATAFCPSGYMEKEYLKSRKVAFEDIVIDQNPGEEQQRMHTCGAMNVPCIHITQEDGSEERIPGFNKVQIDAALGL